MSQGIIIGCDKSQESLLPFFWLNYRLHNSLPLTFMDFGMSEEALLWCKERGNVISIKESLLQHPQANFSHQHLSPDVTPYMREAWFKKPLALMHTPYDQTVWLDVDCLVRSSLSPLFKLAKNESGFTLLKEPQLSTKFWRKMKAISKTSHLYNSGVMAYEKTSLILKLWIDCCLNNTDFRGDQEALSHVINTLNLSFKSINWRYNWIVNMYGYVPKEAKVVHFTKAKGKKLLQTLQDDLWYALKQ